MADKRTVIPYGHPAGERAFEIMQKIAERLWDQAQEATAEFISGSFEGAKTTREWVDGEDYFREIKADQCTYIVSYGFRSKEVAAITAKEALKKCS